MIDPMDEDLLASMAAAEAEDMTLTLAVVAEIPGCWFCDTPAAYDAAVVDAPGRPWAFMCQAHMELHGPRALGAGVGQRLVLAQGEVPVVGDTS